MAKKPRNTRRIERRRDEAIQALQALGFAGRQANDAAAYTLLALLDLPAEAPWSASQSPLLGVTPIIERIEALFGIGYAPNTRETIRDEAVKHFVAAGLLLRNPDDPKRPTNSGKTAYQIEPRALALLRTFGTLDWSSQLRTYLADREKIAVAHQRRRTFARVPVTLPNGDQITLSPGGQNPLIKQIIEEFCPRWVPGGKVAYIGDTEDKFRHLDTAYLKGLGVVVAPSAKMPDVVVHDQRRGWVILIEAIASGGHIDPKRREELNALFGGCRAGLVFVTAFQTRETMRAYAHDIAWATEVWIAEAPDHLIHYNGDRFLGPYGD